MESAVVDELSGEERTLDFWQRLEEQPIVTTHDALHGLLLVADGADPHTTYAQRLEEATRRGWIPVRAEPLANESASVGMVAVAACEILQIKGGLTMRIFGPSPRACTRELVFLEILPMRTEHQSLSGLEFIDVVGRLDDQLEAQKE